MKISLFVTIVLSGMYCDEPISTPTFVDTRIEFAHLWPGRMIPVFAVKKMFTFHCDTFFMLHEITPKLNFINRSC